MLPPTGYGLVGRSPSGWCAHSSCPPWRFYAGHGDVLPPLRHPRRPLRCDRSSGVGKAPASRPLLQGSGLLFRRRRSFLNIVLGNPYDDRRDQRSKCLRHDYSRSSSCPADGCLLDCHDASHQLADVPDFPDHASVPSGNHVRANYLYLPCISTNL